MIVKRQAAVLGTTNLNQSPVNASPHFPRNSEYLDSSPAWFLASFSSSWPLSTFPCYSSKPENSPYYSAWAQSSLWEAFLSCGDHGIIFNTFWAKKDCLLPSPTLAPWAPRCSLPWCGKAPFSHRRPQCAKSWHYYGS